jgi:putative ABC transport system permease protein
MIKNYIKIAFRNLWRHRGFSLINIVGLAVGMSACFLIYIYVKFELSYDKLNKNFDQVYRLNTDLKTLTDVLHWSSCSAPVGPALQADYPEVKANTRIFSNSYLMVRGNHKFQENNMAFAEPSLFKIFTLPFVQGDQSTSLVKPFSVVLTQTTAKKYFGNDNPIGQSILMDGKHPLTVTGVIKDVVLNSHFSFDLLVSLSTMEKLKIINLNEWGNFSNVTYLLLSQGYNASKLQARLPAFLRRHITEDLRKKGYNYDLFVQPLSEVYMDTKRGAQVNGSMSNVYIFSIVAIFILLIACINFINLTTARATERAKEVGIRKVIGAAKEQLAAQFLGESVIICLISFFFSVIISWLLLPTFNLLAGKIISDSIFEHGYLFILFGMALAIGLIAGIYPALILTRFNITSVLKGRFQNSVRGIWLRKGLVVTQFTISIVLIVGTLIVYNQLSFMRNQSLGFKKDQMLVVDFGGDSVVQKNYESIKYGLKQIHGVLSVSTSSTTPGNGNPVAYTQAENAKGTLQDVNINMYDVDYDFIHQYGMQMAAGRTFSTDFGTDTTQSFIINEAAATELGYTLPKNAVGKRFLQWGRKGTIIGVVKDFHYTGLQQNVKSLNFRINPNNFGVFTLKIAAGDIPATIDAIQERWKTLVPQRPFSFSFLDDNFNKQYASEDRFGKLFLYFAVLAIFISCLGLLGLASYSTLQRTREIGIRKVMGASIYGIVNMLSKEFLQLVIIAALVAFPLAWWGMHTWLQDFYYRIDIGWVVFAVAGILSVVIAISTVSFQAIRAALANPVKSLRAE